MFNLLLAVTCAGLTYATSGLFLCQGDISKILVHTPDSKGSFRMMDKDTDYGVFDFGNITTTSGWWIFKRKVVEYKSQEVLINPAKDNPLIIGLTTLDTGPLYGLVESVKIENPLKVAVICGGKSLVTGGASSGAYGEGVATCKAMADSSSKWSLKIINRSIVNIVSTDCQINERFETLTFGQTFDYVFAVKPGICNFTLQVQDIHTTYQAKFLYFGYDRSALVIDSPLLINKKVYKPVNSSFYTVELYKGNKIEKRIVSRDDSIDASWFTEGTLCTFAYTTTGFTSTSCYNVAEQEVPSYFR